MHRPDDPTLMAYADGELETANAVEVEEWAERDPAIGARIDAFLRSRALVQAALAGPMHEPAPRQAAALLGAVAQEAAVAKIVPLRRRPAVRPGISLALAAGFAALVFGFGGGLAWQTSVDRAAFRQALQVGAAAAAWQAVGLALETTPNGRAVPWQAATGDRLLITPVVTFLTEAGEFCRQFRIEGAADETAVACRGTDGAWRPSTVAAPEV